ncbi:ribulose-phosphate 3-epimerase [Amphibacillus marinus]|uniref:Ribulose-phosphate 3-epimerase n=1 Tax=Amphibacillus marinus TaxID=872970 RepID=A0A1H8PH36_9BACI|nr:ribulose-phosphate 3-epimerase [Amphibacillus marinus]SEO41250.1 ribulose-phosphate 3-epimerase [Amphibacillus marinus]
MLKLAPSLLAADFSTLGQVVKETADAGADMLHIDIMDGHFVPNLTFGPDLVKAIRLHSNLKFDVHLMIENPDLYLKAFVDAGADIITVHVETCTHLHRTIQQIKALGAKAGVVLNPATPVNLLEPILKDIDMVLIMTVNPGFGGQSFIPQSIDKIKRLKKMITNNGPCTIDIQVDGGITLDNVQDVINAGANVIVAGSAIYNNQALSDNIKRFKEAMYAANA